MKLLLVLLAWGACQFFPAELTAASIGRLSRQWRDFWLAKGGGNYMVGLGLLVGLPLLLMLLALHGFGLHGAWRAAIAAPLSLAVVLWVALDRQSPDIVHRYRDDWLARNWTETGTEIDLIPPEASLAIELGKARHALLRERLSQLFGPLFWFLLAGPLALTAYYLLRITAELGDEQPAGYAGRQLQLWADWLPARVLALGFALAGNFTTTWAYLSEQLRDPSQPTLELLDGAVEAAHPVSLNLSDEVTPGAALVLALSEVDGLLKRSAIIWIVLLALHTLWP